MVFQLRDYSLLEKSIKKPETKSNKERFNNAYEEVIDFVPLNANLIDKIKHNKSDTEKSRKRNLQMISQYLTLDPVAKKTANATIEQTKLSEDLKLVTLVEHNGKKGQKYAEILSNDITQLKFYNLNKFEFPSQKG